MRYVIRHRATTRQMRGVANIAAPLLAAAAITVVGVVVQDPGRLAWPSLALALLAAAAAAFVTSVGASLWIAYYDSECDGPAVTPRDMPADEYRAATDLYAALGFWVSISRRTYMAGVYALWVGLGVCLVPSEWQWWRLPALIVVGTAVLVEAALSLLAPQAAVEPPVWVAIPTADDEHDDD